MDLKYILFISFGFLILSAIADDSGSFEADCRDSDESSGDTSGDSTSNEDAKSWEESYEEDEQTCEELTEGAEENNGECDLIAGLEIIAESITIIEQKQIFIQFIAKLKAQLSIRVDITIISSMLIEFQEEYPECWELVAYKNITTTGFVLARYSLIVTYKQHLIVERTYIIDASGSCPLIDAFLNFSYGIEGLELAAKTFVELELRPLLMNITLTKEKRVIVIAQMITKFIQSNYECRAFYNAYIVGFGSIRTFIFLSEQYVQLRYVKYTLHGSVSTCVLITALEQRYQELVIEGKLTIAQQISVIIQRCKVEFSSVTSFKARLFIFIKIVREFGRLNWDVLECIFNIYIPKFGCIFRLIHCAKFLETSPIISTTPSCTCTCN